MLPTHPAGWRERALGPEAWTLWDGGQTEDNKRREVSFCHPGHSVNKSSYTQVAKVGKTQTVVAVASWSETFYLKAESREKSLSLSLSFCSRAMKTG